MNPRLFILVMVALTGRTVSGAEAAAAPETPAGMAVIAAGEHRPLFVLPNELARVPVAAGRGFRSETEPGVAGAGSFTCGGIPHRLASA